MPQNKDLSGKDDLWNLEALMPPKKNRTELQAPSHDTGAVELRLRTAPAASSPFADSLFVEHAVSRVPERREPTAPPLLVYAPQSSLLREVRVYAWRTEYDYYEAFCQQARALFSREGGEAPQVEFFSYVPQYNQMSAAQLGFYLWWRTLFRKGSCIPVRHVSYLLLFLYEVINVGDLLDPAEGQAQLLRLWLAYRDAHPRLDPLIREWLCDYSLLNRLSAPVLPLNLYRELLSGCKLKEFYVPLDGEADAMTNAVLAFCNNYGIGSFSSNDNSAAGDPEISGNIIRSCLKEDGPRGLHMIQCALYHCSSIRAVGRWCKYGHDRIIRKIRITVAVSCH